MGATESIEGADPMARRSRTTRKALLDSADPGWVTARAFSAESLEDESDAWAPGAEYAVAEGGLTMRKAPFGKVAGCLKSGTRVLLLKTQEESGVVWGLVDPPTSTKERVGWAVLMVTDAEAAAKKVDDATPPGTGPFLQRLNSGWEVGRSYMAKQGICLRSSADLSSNVLCELESEEMVEILEFGIHEESAGDKPLRPRLRAKILTWKTHRTGWVSPRTKNGKPLLVL